MKLHILGANRAEVELSNGVTVLFSYKTPVAAIIDGKAYKTDCRWSRTTSKHIGQWERAFGSYEERPQSFFDQLAS